MLNPTDPLINLAKVITLLPDYLIKNNKINVITIPVMNKGKTIDEEQDL